MNFDKKYLLIILVLLVLISLALQISSVSKIAVTILTVWGFFEIFDFFFDIRSKVREKDKTNKAYRALWEKEKSEKRRIMRDLKEERKRKFEIKSEKRKKERRLEYVKKTLERKGIDTTYIVEKYSEPLKSILVCITHTKRNPDKKFILNRLSELGAKPVQGATKIIPPIKIEQEIESRKDLENWFHQEVLQDKDLNYKLELLTTIDLKKVYSEDKIGGESYFQIFNEMFDIDDLVSEDDFVDIMKKSKKISLEDEIRENIGLLLVPIATKKELDVLLKPENQLEIQRELGGIIQIINSSQRRIEKVLSKYVEEPAPLTKELKEEARRMKQHLKL